MEETKKETKEVGKYKNDNLEIAVHEVGEDNTKYGEFVSTYFAWIPLSKQKERAREMEKMTKKRDEKSKAKGWKILSMKYNINMEDW